MAPRFTSKFCLLILICLAFSLQAQVEPTLPNTAAVLTCFPDTTGYKVFTVGPINRDFSDLQSAINAATLGSVLILDASVSFNGGFQLPDKGAGEEWIIIMSSRMDLLPKDETRINPSAPTGNANYPTQRDAMPKIVTTNLSGIPCFATQAKAHHYRLVGLEITADQSVLNSYGLINLGDASSAQNSISLVPHHFVIDRCFIHGHTQADIMKFGVRLDCANAAIIDSYIADFHSIGFDAQAIAGINGPGPFKILNNYLEASGENILFGGAAPAITGLVPSDIEVRQNYFYKPWSWRVGDPNYAGKHWTIKNLFELKTGKRVWLDGNVMENCWADLPIGQSGYAILLTVRVESGAAPQADVSDILITNNIIRHVGAGITLSGTDGGAGIRSSRIKISNNLFEDINGPAYGDQNVDGPNDGTFLKIGEPQDVWVDHNTILQSGPITWAYDITDRFLYTHNISHSYVSAGGYQGIYGPGYSQGNNSIAHYFPDVTDANKHIHQDILIGGDINKYTNYNTNSHNYFPAGVNDVGFTDYANGNLDYHNYALSAGSPFAGIADFGSDPGVDFAKLDSAFVRDRGCPEIMTAIKGDNEELRSWILFPNPVKDILYVNANDAVGYSYTIIHISGRVVLAGRCVHPLTEINVDGLSGGVYVLTMNFGKSFRSYLFVVE